MRIPYRTWQIVTLTTMLLAACAQSRPASNPGDADVTDGGESGDSLGLADGEDEGGMDGADAGDPGGDSAGDPGLPPGDSDPCDRDADGYLARSCGGEDCDDDDRFVHPGVTDDCDFVDANCDGNLNDDRECWFYAHTPETLYQVDPFRQTAVEVTEVPSYMWDVDTHPNGTLYGVGNFGLYKYDEQDGWDLLGDDNLGGNGLAIDAGGTAYMTWSDELYTVNLRTGQATLLGQLGGDTNGTYFSSGDCVVNKDNSLYMTSSHTATDTLVRINAQTHTGTSVGDTGFVGVYGLTSAWGTMFGLTGEGELISIDPQTGAGTLLHIFADMQWFGAASTPGR